MEAFLKFINSLIANAPEVVGGISLILSGIIAICLIIPGDQPEKFLQSVVDFLAKFSRKPKE